MSMSERSRGDVAAKPGWAATAASRARTPSVGEASATAQIATPVAGSTTSNVAAVSPSTQRPSMYS